MINHSNEQFIVEDGERIAQMVITKYKQASWVPVDTIEELGTTERGSGGFGHTGKK